MTPRQPTTELDARYSSALNPRPGAENVTATDWAEAQRRLCDAEVFWITTVRADGRLAIAAFEAQYGDPITSPEGAFFGFGDSIREGRDLLFAVAPITAYGFGHDGQVFSHTRYTF
ncbi:hypothetical protein ABZ702_32350 [Streptomyces cyaneofuscatus]|uniref:hypothetical protein n=1 Tax=Streptomyces cyaneofuscatus TaxID=66883 RepID=UPI0033E1D972